MSQPGDVSLRNRSFFVFDLRRGVCWGHGEEETQEFDEEILLSGLLADASNTGSHPLAPRSWVGRERHYLVVGTVRHTIKGARRILETVFGRLYVRSGGRGRSRVWGRLDRMLRSVTLWIGDQYGNGRNEKFIKARRSSPRLGSLVDWKQPESPHPARGQ